MSTPTASFAETLNPIPSQVLIPGLLERTGAEAILPDPELTVSEWANEYRWLSSRYAAEHGKWRTDRTPYLGEIMDCLSATSPYEQVIFMKGSQIGGTECGNNWLGYLIHHAPGPTLYVQPSVELAKAESKQRLEPLIDESRVLRERVKERRSRDSGNTILAKEFPGGILLLTGANSAKGLRRAPIRNVFLDEIDEYPGDVDKQGDPVQLAEARTRNFSRKKIYKVSSPTVTGLSRIEGEFEMSDKRFFFVPCPFCRHYQVLKFSMTSMGPGKGWIRWPKGRPDEAVYICEGCGAEIEEHHKMQMLSEGKWRATARGDGKRAGFHLSSMYSPLGWFSWTDAAAMWGEAQKKPEKLQVFVNTVLGETWTQRGDAPDWKRLYDRREQYAPGTCPEGVLFLTAGVDVQLDRIEVQVVGWGREKESWLVDYIVLDGHTSLPEVWNRLTEATQATYPHDSGADLGILRLAIDSGAATQRVYDWVRRQPPGRVIAVKGEAGGVAPIWLGKAIDLKADGRRVRRPLRPWHVNTGMLKSELYGWLRLDRPAEESGEAFPAGYCHFPEMPEEFFQQLTSEQLVTKTVKGYRKTHWELIPNRRNEVLDNRVYARAAASHLGMDRFREREWARLEQMLGAPAREARPKAAAEKEPEPEPAKPREERPGRGGSWLGDRSKNFWRS